MGDILRDVVDARSEAPAGKSRSRLVDTVVIPTIADARRAFLAALDGVSIEDMVRQAERQAIVEAGSDPGGFVI